MPIEVPCRCGRVLLLPDDLAGRTGRCKTCGERLLVPFLREGGGAAVIRAETGPIELEDVAEPVLCVATSEPKVEAVDWILPPDPPPGPAYREPLVSIVEPGEGCVLAGLRAAVRLVCWYLLVMGLLGGVLRGDLRSLLTAVVAGIVLALTRWPKESPYRAVWDHKRDTPVVVRGVVYGVLAVAATFAVGALIYTLM
mgnify:CR=1 FL=1